MSLRSSLTPSIKPSDDFYLYVNKKWIDEHPIPADKSSYGTFTELSDKNMEFLHELLQSTDDAPNNIQLAREFYRTAMDEAAIEKQGLKPVEATLKKIKDLKNFDDAVAFITTQHTQGRSFVWNPAIEPDDKNSNRYILRFHQAGLGMPDREYYLEKSEAFSTIRQQYHQFLAGLFVLLGVPESDAAVQAQTVMDVERALARVSATATQKYDPVATYNPFTLEKLTEELPHIEWKKYTESLALEGVKDVVVSWPPFMKGALEHFSTLPISTLQSYLTAHYLLPLLDKLPKDFDRLRFEFYGKVLSGASEQEPRHRRVIRLLERVLPEPLGQLYVEAHFDEHAKHEIYDLVRHMQSALQERIRKLEWMSDETKERALGKLDTFLPLLGYPDEWKDYSELPADKTHVENFLAALKFDWDYRAERINQVVDRYEWGMSPATVNAYYWPSTNQITFPAAILQPPFFNASGDFAANYGGIGAVIGHEMLHGFDDDGSKYDQDGNMQSWWSDEDQKAFDERVAKLEQQYSQYEVDGRNVNGTLTLGENIADLGGILLAYDGLQKKIAEDDKLNEKIDSLTPEQRFFISYAHTWGQNIRPELRTQYLITDPHSPNEHRVNGVVVNVDSFYEAFGGEPGDRLYLPPENRVRIW